RGANMDTLVALGSTTAYAYSVWALFGAAGGHLYFMEAAAIITLISVGHWLEARVSERASTSLRALLELAPATARQCNAAGAEIEVPVAALKIGDRVALRPGDRVPVDGVVVEGDSAVDESMLTGESRPVDKAPGAPVYAGTMNLSGRLVARVTATGETTALAAIIRAVQRAQTSRAGIQRLGDRVSSVFVPAVVLIALAAALWWGLDYEQAHHVNQRLAPFLWTAHPPPTPLAAAVVAAAAVLIIACPCAMGLATPAAIMAGADAAARRGILIRDGVALEKAGSIDTVIFDKTGTLTEGRPAVTGVEVLGELDPQRARELAAALARHSTHPFSRAIAGGITSDIEIEGWREVRGAGLEGVWRDRSVRLRLGSLEWLVEGPADGGPAQARARVWRDTGATVIGLSLDGKLIALFALADPLKPGVAEVLRRLGGKGLRPLLVTGDSARTAAAVARQIGLAEADVFAEVKPEQKAGLVQQLQSRGARVAFVGDGLNDGPALEQADLGIAVSKASDVAREAADIVLLRSDIEAVPECLGLARATLRVIRQNLFWAFFYNALGVPLAALGFMSPVLCAAAMGLSDLVVIGNALRLRGRRWWG
ncbi:MAG TPA: heavy metal translocating P-type ATPase, partial [Methylomirabilota bacterium]|nr:heavy metal translocating P-type ATPase [Methylomirabilota bacterium]